jgi:hypothetical protein
VYVVKTYVLTPKEEDKSNDSSKGSNASNNSSSSSNNSNSSTPAPPKVSSSDLPILGSDTILKRGDKAAEVKYIQHEYNTVFLKNIEEKTGEKMTKLSEDGIFGEKTENAVFELTGKKSISWNAFKKEIDEQADASFTALLNSFIPDWMQP